MLRDYRTLGGYHVWECTVEPRIQVQLTPLALDGAYVVWVGMEAEVDTDGGKVIACDLRLLTGEEISVVGRRAHLVEAFNEDKALAGRR